MKKTNVYPDWVEKYRGKGKTIRKVRDGYGLYECTSIYVPGRKYPKSVQKYLGMITKEEGFIPKKSVLDYQNYSIEYGLSHFIITNFKRSLLRSTYDSNMNIVLLGIIFYIFGSIDKVFLSSSYLTIDLEVDLNSVSNKRVKGISNKIDSLLKEKISDDNDRLILIKLLSLCTIVKGNNIDSIIYPDIVKEIIERYGLKL